MKQKITLMLGVLGVVLALTLPLWAEYFSLSTARMDVYDLTPGKTAPSFVVQNMKLYPLGWMERGGQHGHMIQNSSGHSVFDLTGLEQVDVLFALKGPDIPNDPADKTKGRQERWITYTRFDVNGVPQLSEPLSVWHNTQRILTVPVAPGETTRVEIEWERYAGYSLWDAWTKGLTIRWGVLCALILGTLFAFWGLLFVRSRAKAGTESAVPAMTGRDYLRFILRCSVVFVICLGAVWSADVLRYDDLNRNMLGTVSDWATMNRWVAMGLVRLMNWDGVIANMSPLSQIITLCLMAGVCAVLVRSFAPESVKSPWMIVAVMPVVVNPFFLENISFKIECVIHGFTALFCVAPMLLYRRRDWTFAVAAGVGAILMCLTYQGVSGIFPMCLLLAASLEWNDGRRIREIGRSVVYGGLGYVIGLIVFAKLIMRPIQTKGVNSDMWTGGEMLTGLWTNWGTYEAAVLRFLTPAWVALCVATVVMFVVVYTLSSHRNRFGAAVMAGLTACGMSIVCFGAYLGLQVPPVVPRTLAVFFYVIGALMIVVVARGAWLGRALACVMAFCFVAFACIYGNCLREQQAFEQVRLSAVWGYLNDHYQADTPYTLEVVGDGGFAPAVRNKMNTYPVLKELVPNYLNFRSMWARYIQYDIYGLPNNFQRRIDIPLGLDKMNLPRQESKMTFDVFSDGSRILIRMK